MRILSFVVLFLTWAISVFGQTSSLHGTIVDQESGEEIIGANVLIVGTTIGASTDLDGKYAIRNVTPGTYDIRVSYVGYASQLITGTVLKPGESLQLDIGIVSEAYSSEEVVTTAERVLSTESSILAERKKAASIGDGISAEQVKRSPDATSGDALKRVTGLTVVDNKFVFIRGVTDRYNGATLNGVSVTSTDTDVDKKSFSFDMVPANLLENMVVTKTATPDLPGDFTGGLVQINTLEFPARQTIRLSLSSSYNSISNLTNIQTSQGGSRDWLGFDDGSRSQPPDALDRYALGQQLSNSWAQRTRRAPLNGGFNLSVGDRIEVGEQDLLGYIAAVSYRNGFQRTETRLDYETSGGVPVFQDGKRDQYSVLWGTILDVNYKFSGMHKISFQNSFNQTGEDKVSRLNGIDENEQNLKTEVVEWDQRSGYVGKISGEHNLPGFGGLEVRWRGAYTLSTAKEPDRRTSIYARNIYYSDPEPFSTSSPQRSWSTLNEYTRSAGLDFSLPVGDAQFKIGGLYESRDRDFDIRFYVTELENPANVEMWNQGLDSIYRPENFGPGRFYMQRLDNNRDPYTGELDVIASYAMIDLPFTMLSQDLRIVGGARVENADQRVHTVDPDIAQPTPFTVLLKNVDVLPSVNLTWFLNDITNLRFAYSNSVNRPEFREMSDFYYFDYNTFEGMHGNTDLKRALIRNYDARLEVFPGIGEVFAVSYFYKDITDAIEQSLIISSNPERSWFNSPRGRNYGWELEIRKSFGFMRDSGAPGLLQDVLDYLANISVTGNYTRIHSEVDFIDERTLLPGKREMQGQSPWMANVSVSFVEPVIGTGVNVMYSEFGRRLDAVGDYTSLDVFEDPRSVIDLSLTQPIVGGVEVKFSVKDLTAQDKTFTYRRGEKYKKVFSGRSFSLQASLTL